MKRTLYRMLCDGETEWQGNALDTSEAEEKCFWDEPPGSLNRYTLQRWGTVKLTSSIKDKGWVTIYANQALAFT
jgi:hypothetical protein